MKTTKLSDNSNFKWVFGVGERKDYGKLDLLFAYTVGGEGAVMEVTRTKT